MFQIRSGPSKIRLGNTFETHKVKNVIKFQRKKKLPHLRSSFPSTHEGGRGQMELKISERHNSASLYYRKDRWKLKNVFCFFWLSFNLYVLLPRRADGFKNPSGKLNYNASNVYARLFELCHNFCQ